jgi:hypothetical protein
MRHSLRSLVITGSALTLLSGVVPAALAAGSPAAARLPVVQHVGQIDQQDVHARNGCEPDTLVEPDIAVSPVNPSIMVAVAHDCRFATGGAVDISYAWTHDGGTHWQHAPMPGLTKAVGGVWDRASDPVVAFGPDGSVYVSALVFDAATCPTGVAVSRSTDGGATFGPPVLVQKSTTCNYSDDKNWLVIDDQPNSPFYGRLYQFWTPFLAVNGHAAGSPQVVRWSDDQGRRWSATHVVSAPHENTQNSQPMIQPDGTITDVYQNFGGSGATGGPMGGGGEPRGRPQSAAAGSGVLLVARTSADGGAHWSGESVVARNTGGGPAGIRCCLPASTADPVTGEMYTVWDGNGPGTMDPVWLSRSRNGVTWSAPVRVSRDPLSTIQHINLAVAAYSGKVFVAYGTRNTAVANGNLVQQQVSSSYDAATSFGPPLSVGPLSDLRYAAVAGGKFPGDYAGASETSSVLSIAWCVSSKPPNPARAYHQTLYAAVLRP